MPWNDETENYVSSMDTELLSRTAQQALKALVGNYNPVTGLFPSFGGGATAANLSVGAVTSTVVPITNSNGTGVTIPAATTGAAGVLAAADKTKLDSLSSLTYTGVWASRPASPTTGDRIRVTDVHPLTTVDFRWNGTAWVPTAQPAAQRDVYVQPSDGTTWAARPNGSTINIPVWASKLTMTIASGGGGGGSGRRGALATARSGGQGGPGGNTNMFSVPLRNTDGTLISASLNCTVGLGALGGAAIVVDDNNGNPGGGATIGTLVALGSTTYRSCAGGSAAAGGATSSLGNNATGVATLMPAPYSWGNTSVVAQVSMAYSATCTASGGGGGSIDTANAAVAPGGFSHIAMAAGNSLTPGVIGLHEVYGNMLFGRAPTGGAASSTAAAQAGAQGIAGCGGAGGGASLNGFASGAGGRGGDGWAIFIWE